MSHTPNSLHDEFPQFGDALHRLKSHNGHFGRLSEQYNAINHEIHQIETGLEPASDDRTEHLKKERLALLDEIAILVGNEEKDDGA